MNLIKCLVSFALLVAFIAGCDDGVSSRIASATKHNIRKVAIMYKVYSQSHKFNGPKDEEEFRSWAQGDDQVREQLAKFGIDVDKFDDYMSSDRTNDKFVIRWGVKSRPMAPPYPVVFEPNAVDGVRHVGMAGGKTREVDNDEEYNELMKGNYEPEGTETQQ